MKTIKIVEISNSWKIENTCYLIDDSGNVYRRKYREYNRGRFAGRCVINFSDSVYSVPALSLKSNNGRVYANEIFYEGQHKDVFYKDVRKNKKTALKVERPVEVKEAEKPATVEIAEHDNEVRHEAHDDIKQCIEASIPVYLVGPAGSGKNYTLEQMAYELGWNFYFSNSVQHEYKLTGFIDANGIFHETEFYKACASGKDCIFFLDEMDASIPEVLVLLNAAIANNYFEFPNGKINDLSHVHFVAAGNTFGNGADEVYTGRMQLDGATLDRFAVIEFNYSRNVELKIADGNEALVDFVRDVREAAEENGIKATFSYRCISAITKLSKGYMELSRILEIAMFKGMDADTLNTIVTPEHGAYTMALRTLQVNKTMNMAA